MLKGVIAGMVLAGGVVQAGVLSAWEVDGVVVAEGTGIDTGSAPYTFTAGEMGTNVNDAKLSLGNVNPSTTAGQYGMKISAGDEQTNLAGAIANDQYIQFTVTAAEGYGLNLESIEINGQSSGTGADDVAILSDVDGFAADQVIDSVTGISDVTGGFDTDDSGFGAPINASGASFQGLESVTFRLYGWGTTSGDGVTYLRNLSGDNLIVNGTVSSIPEPAVSSLIILGGTALLCRRRR